jgi:catechol 2,3-dioxygenase-like lactoylglutathione lyase family enzyme
MNTDTIVHPKLQHYGLITGNLDAMIDWYRKVLGMTVNHRSARPASAAGGPPFTGLAFVSNDEVDHRIVFFEMPDAGAGADRRRKGPLQHVAFKCESLDDLLGTYVRLKKLGVEPVPVPRRRRPHHRSPPTRICQQQSAKKKWRRRPAAAQPARAGRSASELAGAANFL